MNESENTQPTAETPTETPAEKTQQQKNQEVIDNVTASAKDALGVIGNVFKKAGEAAVNVAEQVTKTDLNKDGKVGDQTSEPTEPKA